MARSNQLSTNPLHLVSCHLSKVCLGSGIPLFPPPALQNVSDLPPVALVRIRQHVGQRPPLQQPEVGVRCDDQLGRLNIDPRLQMPNTARYGRESGRDELFSCVAAVLSTATGLLQLGNLHDAPIAVDIFCGPYYRQPCDHPSLFLLQHPADPQSTAPTIFSLPLKSVQHVKRV
jgi:hypothetical protein